MEYQIIKKEERAQKLQELDGINKRVLQFIQPVEKFYEAKLIRIDQQPEVLSEMHEQASDIYLITSGSCKLTLGGELIEKKDLGSGDWLGKGIKDGKVHKIEEGDMISIPPYTPHMVDLAGGAVSYIVIKVFNRTIEDRLL